jgi:hypothetical protein
MISKRIGSARGNAYPILVIALVVFALGLRLYRLNTPLLDFHHFRQTQTALSAYWMAQEGITLPAYPLPVFGAPWSAPFEFPLYQILLSFLFTAGLPADAAARGLSVAIYAFTVFSAWQLWRALALGRSVQIGFLFLALFTPFSIKWSRACLIDFLSVAFAIQSLSAMVAAARQGWNWRRFATAGLCASVTALVKLTTLPLVCVPGALVFCYALSGEGKLPAAKAADENLGMLRQNIGIVAWLVVLVVPAGLALIWTHLADVVKAGSPATAWLVSSNLGTWTMGSWTQRTSIENWNPIFSRLRDQVIPVIWPCVPLGIFAVIRQERFQALLLLGLALGMIVAVGVFFNLYVVHDYYLCAIVIPVWILAALGIDHLAAQVAATPYARIGVVACAAVLVGISTCKSDYTKASYLNYSQDPYYLFANHVRSTVAPKEEIIVFGDDWNPRIPYYAQRKALMVRGGADTAYVVEYARSRHVAYLVSTGAELARVRTLWPRCTVVFEEHGVSLLQINR